MNKLTVLNKAVRNSLNIPDHIITNDKTRVLEFNKCHKKIITKPISDNPRIFDTKEELLETRVKSFSHQELKLLPSKFFYSLWQEYISKSYEIRIFYLNEIIYPVGILSQVKNYNLEDFRDYNINIPYFPIKLDNKFESKLLKFLIDVGIDGCSVDIVVNEEGDYYFLEINPVGQIGMVSYPSNFNLEKVIADTLIEYGKYGK